MFACIHILLPKKTPPKHRVDGVGFTVENTFTSTIVPPSNGIARVLSRRITTSTGTVNIMNIYVPTLCPSQKLKEEKYEELYSTTKRPDQLP